MIGASPALPDRLSHWRRDFGRGSADGPCRTIGILYRVNPDTLVQLGRSTTDPELPSVISGGAVEKSILTESQIVAIFKEGDAGLPVAQSARIQGISIAACYIWLLARTMTVETIKWPAEA